MGKRSDVLWMPEVRCFDVHAWGMALYGSVDWVRLALKEADFSGDGGVVLICILKVDDLLTNSKSESQWQQSRLKAATKIAANQRYHLLPGA
jgi:hypothetical protein